jgi:hypothetical protein
MPLAVLALAVPLALLAGGCGRSAAKSSTAAASPARLTCPAAWAAGWRKLAKRIDAPVYCPTWMPQPLDGKIGGDYAQPPYLGPERSYLVSFLWFEKMPTAPYEVHVNLRGYPGRIAIPTCQDTLTTAGKTFRPKVPCFADPRGHVTVGNTSATIYTVNQGIDTWHVLFAWHHDGSLYTISQHLAPPFTYSKVVQNLTRMLRGLVLVEP